MTGAERELQDDELPPDPDELGLIPDADAYPDDETASAAVASTAWDLALAEQEDDPR